MSVENREAAKRGLTMPIKSLDQETLRSVAHLLAADAADFSALVRVAGLDPARDFRHTDMSGTSMAGADLRGFDFTGADFRNVKLDGARIDGACFKGADLSGTDLSAARGIEAADCSFAAFQDGAFAPEMVMLPAGAFLMGSPEDERGRRDEEGPQRLVRVAGFAIGRHTVTFAEYEQFCQAAGRRKRPEDEGWGRGRLPVINVAWHDARRYVAWLATETGKAYRLPSEAEWEYACRAGTTTAYWWGDSFNPAMANTRESGLRRTTEVGAGPANAWGLFNILGNVFEWTEDHWHEMHKGVSQGDRAPIEARARKSRAWVLRGGSWDYDRDYARCADRRWGGPNDRGSNVGFRVVCSLPS